jgi:hypothetical protein
MATLKSPYGMEMADNHSTSPSAPWTDPIVERREPEMPTGWKYKTRKLGPVTLPHYASPESQLILVSFVCFLCPGEPIRTTSLFLSTAELRQECSMPSPGSVAQDN